MIISHEHEFVFVKTHKTAGSSIEAFLARHAGDDAVVTPLSPMPEGHRPRNTAGLWNPLPELRRRRRRGLGPVLHDLRHRARYYEHMRAKLIRDRLGHRRWDRYLTFCFERDPWEKVVSSYYWQLSRGAFEGSLDDFARHARLPTDWPMYTINGSIGVDMVVRYERLEVELRRILDRVGIGAALDLPALKRGIRPSGTDGGGADASAAEPRLSAEADRRIADLFRREINAFGYRDRSEPEPPPEHPTSEATA